MRTLRFAFGLLASGLGAVPAQQLGRCRVEHARPALARVLAAAAAGAPRPAPVATVAFLHHVLDELRRGELDATAMTLRDAQANGVGPVARAIATLWHARAAGVPALDADGWAALAAEVERAPRARGPFADAALAVHARFCVAALGDLVAGVAAGDVARCTARALDAQLALERAAWRERPGCFATRLGRGGDADGAIPGDASTLLPPSLGALLATADRVPRHLASVAAAAAERLADADTATAALLLQTAVQLGDEPLRARAWRRLLATADGPLAGDDAGIVVDALLFAVTGVRVATGAGVDDGWLRCTPWLPPDHERLAVHGIRAAGATFDLELAAADGAGPGGRDVTAHLGGDGPRVEVTVRLHATHDARPRALTVASRTHRTAHWLAAGEAFGASLPRPQPDAQQEPHPLAPGGPVR
jgi:hypothetical protein